MRSADGKIDIAQKIAGFVETEAGNVVDKLYSGDILEFFAQIARVDVDCSCYLAQRKFIHQMLANESARLPNFCRLGLLACRDALA